jgi:Cdc6-like AAA superfamily ATPase
MPEPLTITAIGIATLAFGKFLEDGAIKLGEKFLEGGVTKLGEKFSERALENTNELRKKIWNKLRGNQDAETALNAVEQKGEEIDLEKIANYLQIAMEEDPKFASELKAIAQEITVINNGEVIASQGAIAIKGNIERNIFQTFIQAPTSISQHIYIQDFQSLVEERTRNFIGREFVFKAIEKHLRDPEFPSGYIIIEGEPGVGKTSLIAYLVKQKGAIHHFNIALQNIRTTQDFLGNICAQLIARYNLNYSFIPPEARQNSGFLSQLLSEAALLEDKKPFIVLVDALDEVDDANLAPSVNRLYLPPSLPNGVFFIITTRKQDNYRLFVDSYKDIYLDQDDPQNRDDVRQYILNFLQRHYVNMTTAIKQWHISEEEFIDTLAEKSEGNFMYIVYVLQDIQNGKLTSKDLDNIRKLPKGLRAYYQNHWLSMGEKEGNKFDSCYKPVICVLATVREPISVKKIVELTKVNSTEIVKTIQEWREFLKETETDEDPLYRIYHSSFQNFLAEEVGLSQYNSMIAQSILDKIQW